MIPNSNVVRATADNLLPNKVITTTCDPVRATEDNYLTRTDPITAAAILSTTPHDIVRCTHLWSTDMTDAEDWDYMPDDTYKLYKILKYDAEHELTERKLRLICANFARVHEFHRHPEWHDVLMTIENVADNVHTPFGPPSNEALVRAKQSIQSVYGWLWAGLQMELKSVIEATFRVHQGFQLYWADHRTAAIIHDMFCNPFRPIALPICDVCAGDYKMRWIDNPDTGICTACRGGSKVRIDQVLQLAHEAYNNRLPTGQLHPDRLMVLSDAMEEYGCNVSTCTNCSGVGQIQVCDSMFYGCEELGCEDSCTHKRSISCARCSGKGVVPHSMVAHLRKPVRGFGHFRGCWVIDKLLVRDGW